MKIRVLTPFLALGALVLIVSLACITTTPTAPPPPTQGIQPTQPPLPTSPPAATATEATPAFFTEEFTTDFLANWSYFLTSGEDRDFSLTSGNDRLTFDITATNTWTYLLYDPYIYTDVRIDTRATNLGYNNNNVSFICRYTGDDWYEVNVYNSGLYDILYGKWDADGVGASYDSITDGGISWLKTGKDTNEYVVMCVDNEISLYVNAKEVTTVEVRSYNLREGQVGIGVSSFNVVPITVEFDYVTISEP